MARYRRRWTETRGEEFDAWRAATYVVLEQIEICDDGHVLSYDATRRAARPPTASDTVGPVFLLSTLGHNHD
jgi:hypothetical protein